ncbi:S26 family signal peptidase, partial [uncultured Vibrio sp.]
DVPVIQLAVERGYLQWGACSGGSTPLIKTVIATQGDQLAFDDVVSMNGQPLTNYVIHRADDNGRTLPLLAPFTVAENEFFALSEYAPSNSFDGRY